MISTPTGVGGAERVLEALVQGGDQRGWDQLVLNPFARADGGLAEILGPARYVVLPATRVSHLPGMIRIFRERLADYAGDLIHAHLFHAIVLSGLSAPRRYRSVLSQQHGDHLVRQGRKVEATLDRVATGRFDRVVASSNAVRRFLVDGYRIPDEKIVTIHNGWQGTPASNPSTRYPHTTIGSVGNLRDEKGHATLIEAFADVRSSHEARLLLVGDGPLRSALEQQATDLGVRDDVEFTGAVADVWPYLEQMDIFVLPSKHEALGIAALEAMAAGVPVVASDVGGIPEIVENDRTGLLVPPQDPRALAERIERLLTHPELAETFRVAARRSVESHRMGAMVDRYFDLYESLL